MKLVKTHDTDHKISMGFAIGIALGIIPGTGPLAALTVAFLLRANRASALLGSLMVNTWISVVLLVPAVQIAGLIFKLNWHTLYASWLNFLTSWRWQDVLRISIYKFILPILIGYGIISVGLSISAYIICRLILLYKKWR